MQSVLTSPFPHINKIRKGVRLLKNRKSPGEDGLLPELYEAADEIVAAQLKPFFEEIWMKKDFPDGWKVSVLLPFPKKGNKSECKNYHEIAC